MLGKILFRKITTYKPPLSSALGVNTVHSRYSRLQTAGVALFFPSLAIANDGMGAPLEPFFLGAFLVAGTAAAITLIRLKKSKRE